MKSKNNIKDLRFEDLAPKAGEKLIQPPTSIEEFETHERFAEFRKPTTRRANKKAPRKALRHKPGSA